MEENNPHNTPAPELPNRDAAQQPQYTSAAPQQQAQPQYSQTSQNAQPSQYAQPQYAQYSQPASQEYTYGQGNIQNQDTYQYGAQPAAQTGTQAGGYQYQQAYGQPYEQQYQQPYGQAYQNAQGYPYPPATAAGYGYVGQKSKIAAGLLGIFLGCFGAHNFYLGYTGKAVAQLLLTILTLGFASVITGIWALIEAILILSSSTGSDWHRDAQGYELRD